MTLGRLGGRQVGRLVRRPVAVLLAGLLGFTAAAMSAVPAQAEPVSGDLTWGVSGTYAGFGHEVLEGVTFDGATNQFTFPADGVRTAEDGTVTASFSGSAEKGFTHPGTGALLYSVTIADPQVVVRPDGTGRIEATVHSTGNGNDPTVQTPSTVVTVVEFSDATFEGGSVRGTPDWEGVLPAGSKAAQDLGIDNTAHPVTGRAFHPDFLGAIDPSVRAHFYWSSGSAAKRPADFQVGDPGNPTPTPEPEPEPSPEPEPEPSPEPEPTEPEPTEPVQGRTVSDAVFNWSVSDQTNARSHNPLAINFLGAGTTNPGRGGATVRENQWSATSGPVTIQKRTTGGGWETATWAGLRTDAEGERIGMYGPFSGHRVNIVDGSGQIDPSSNSADLAWKGTFTVVYYGGNTVFTLTDPELKVRNGKGTLSATAGGWAAAREDTQKWAPVDSEKVIISTLSGVRVTQDGLVVTPDYAGVRVTGSETQIRTGEHWGSFHQQLVTFLVPLGTDQFWYSTGLQADWTKLPSPVVVGWEGAAPREPNPTKPPTKRPDPVNPVNPAPDVPPSAGRPPTSLPPPSPLAAPALPLSAPLAAALPAVPGFNHQFPGQPVQVTAGDAGLRQVSSAMNRNAPWYVAGGLLLAASAVLLAGPGRRRTP